MTQEDATQQVKYPESQGAGQLFKYSNLRSQGKDVPRILNSYHKDVTQVGTAILLSWLMKNNLFFLSFQVKGKSNTDSPIIRCRMGEELPTVTCPFCQDSGE